MYTFSRKLIKGADIYAVARVGNRQSEAWVWAKMISSEMF